MKITELQIYDKVKLSDSSQVYTINEERELRYFCQAINGWYTESNIDYICREDWEKV